MMHVKDFLIFTNIFLQKTRRPSKISATNPLKQNEAEFEGFDLICLLPPSVCMSAMSGERSVQIMN